MIAILIIVYVAIVLVLFNSFVSPATPDQMRARTDWGNLLPPPNQPQPPAPGLPGPEDIGPTVRPPEW